MSIELDKRQWEVAERLRYDHSYFARHVHRIEPKDLTDEDPSMLALYDALNLANPLAGTVPFIFRPGQAKLAAFVEAMKAELGYVRAALVKPRQVGWSTYIHSRGHWLGTHTPGMRIQIVSHSSESTKKFLRRVKKLSLGAPDFLAQAHQVDNSKELIFTNGTTYGIATAGSPDSVRSDSCHFLHASEEPYWENAIENTGAIIPALSRARGSEGYRESTSRGKGDPWHNFIMESLAGENMWRVFFDAWFNHPLYRMAPPPGWEPDDEARETKALYNLDDSQLYWRAMMIKDLRALWMFKQEYPGTIDESFQSSADTLYPPDAIYRARKNNGKISLDSYAPLIMGVDPARTGDRTVIAFRQGNVYRKIIKYEKMDDMRLVGIVAGFLKNGLDGTPVKKCFIDYAIGEGVASRLRELEFGRQVMVVNFGEAASDPRYANKRTEMYMDFKEWLGDGKTVSIPDEDDISADLLAMPDFLQGTESDKIKLVPKIKIKKEFGRSPDIADAMVLCHAYPVAAERIAELQQYARTDLGHLAPNELVRVLGDFASS